MPYIKPEARPAFNNLIVELAKAIVEPGELNYVITQLVHTLSNRARPHRNYSFMNGLVGALECAKLELYRRMLAPYEDQKIAQNGDVTGLDTAEKNPRFD